MESIRKYHVEERGYKDIGYHFLIERDGFIHAGRPIGKIGAHVKGKNRHSIGVAVICNNADILQSWTAAQRIALACTVRVLSIIFPEAKIGGHNDYANTDCPGAKINLVLERE